MKRKKRKLLVVHQSLIQPKQIKISKALRVKLRLRKRRKTFRVRIRKISVMMNRLVTLLVIFFIRKILRNRVACLFFLADLDVVFFSRVLFFMPFGQEAFFDTTNANQERIFVSEFVDTDNYEVLRVLQQRAVKNGLLTKSRQVFYSLLAYLKWKYRIEGNIFITEFFVTAFKLPFKLYVYRKSNRSFYFPGPLFSEREELQYLLRFLSRAIKNQVGLTFFIRFMTEFIALLGQNPESLFLRNINDFVAKGIENRAFMHYRWRLHKRR